MRGGCQLLMAPLSATLRAWFWEKPDLSLAELGDMRWQQGLSIKSSDQWLLLNKRVKKKKGRPCGSPDCGIRSEILICVGFEWPGLILNLNLRAQLIRG